MLEAAPNGMVSDALAMQILNSIGAKTVVLKMQDSRRLLAASDMPPEVDVTADIRGATALRSIAEAFDTLFAQGGRTMRVVGDAPMGGEFVEIVMDEMPLKTAMYAFSRNILLVSLVISAISASLVYLALSWMIVRPMRRLARAMTAVRRESGGPGPHRRRLLARRRDR